MPAEKGKQRATHLAPSDKSERAKERKERRKASAEAKKKAADALKDKGNTHYRNGEYDEAVRCYEDAVMAYGPKAVYMSNLAAALLKVEKYTEAEAAASTALHRDPKLLKARYRRALARKGEGRYAAALIDLYDVVQADPTCQEAIDARREIYEAGGHLENPRDVVEGEEWDPRPEEPPEYPETPVPSDTEEYRHYGNGIPCRFYNHEGCNQGERCKFKHAADNRSVRDDLGRNVCLFYIFGLCKFALSECHYANDKSYISSPNFNNPQWIHEMRRLIELVGGSHSAQTLEGIAPLFKEPLDTAMWIPRLREEQSYEASGALIRGYTITSFLRTGRLPIDALDDFYDDYDDYGFGAPPRRPQRSAATAGPAPQPGTGRRGGGRRGKKGKKNGKKGTTAAGTATSSNQPAPGQNGATRSHTYPGGHTTYEDFMNDFYPDENTEELMEQRMNNGGFTDDEVQELLCQGVKPWDDDAWDVLAALSGDYDYY